MRVQKQIHPPEASNEIQPDFLLNLRQKSIQLIGYESDSYKACSDLLTFHLLYVVKNREE